ncbi:prolyl oligopeptidase family serine peptidase [Sphingomonas sp. LHG3443-2]|uniref:prolyl oligopeptidase family serine peptidase n=1 Tax=Sphingomonas sp. LHG3443-2 TaxID=2804639 RepID=UPI003CEF7D3F
MRLMLPAAAFLLIAAAPPPAPVETVTDDYYGTKVSDDYRWMESGKDPRWMPWLKAQGDYTRSVMDALPGRAALLKDLSARSGALASVGTVQWAGSTMIYRERPVGAEDFRLMVRGVHKEPRVLFDPATAKTPEPMVLDDYALSPDGKTVAVSMSKRGTERSVVRFIDAATGTIRPGELSDAAAVRWLPGSDGITYLKFTGEHGTPSYYVRNQARMLSLGSGEDRAIPTRGLPGVAAADGQWTIVLPEPSSDTAMLMVRDGRSEAALYRAAVADVRAGKEKWQRIADFDDKIVDFSMAGDRLYLTSKKTSSNGEVMLASAASGNLAAAKPIPIPGNPVVESIIATKTGVLVRTLEGGVSGLWFVPADGPARRITLPFAGTINWIEANGASDEALLGLAGWFAPSKQYHLATNGDLHDITMTPPAPFDLAGYEQIRATAKAKDGTAIPYTLLRKKGLGAGPHPTLLDAYGSYGYAMSPRFQSALLPFLDRGGVYVAANVRGGGEFGRAWHEAGKADTKATTWRDAIAVGEKLVADGVTTSPKMTLLGTSAGGVMVGGAINERPDLFGGAIANVGFMNPIRYVSEQNFADIEEWGGPITNAATFRTMYNLDPYAHIKKGAAYPATLVVSGINDPRAATFHSAKYAAKLAASSSSGKPVLLRIDFDAGHGIGSSRSQLDAQWADMLSFVLWQAGAEGFRPQ